MADKQTVTERQVLLRNKRSATAKIRAAFLAEGGQLLEGSGKGHEPDPLCECHNRNPCPLDVELNS